MNRHHDKCAKSIWLTNWSIHPRTHTHIDIQTHTHMLLVNICAIKIRIETWPKQCFVIRMQMEVGKAEREGVKRGWKRRQRRGRDREESSERQGSREWGREVEKAAEIGLTDWSRACWVRRDRNGSEGGLTCRVE